EVTGQFQMLLLILANRNKIGLIEQDIRRHKNGISEKAHARALGVALALVLELGHSLKLAHARDARQHPGELGVLFYIRLNKDRGFGGIDPRGEIYSGEVERLAPKRLRVLRERDRVQVDDAVDAVVIVLH